MQLKLVPLPQKNTIRKVILTQKVDNKESIIYAISKKLKNNPCKIASVNFLNGDQVDVLVINNLKVKNKKGDYVVNTSKKKIIQYKPLHKYKKYFHSLDFEVLAEPILMLVFNEKDIISFFRISTLLDIKYTKKSIAEFVDSEIKKYKNLQSYTKIVN